MEPMYFIGLDVHKRKSSYCVQDGGGKVYAEGSLPATRIELDQWMKTLPQPWNEAMEATMFTGWIYDHLRKQGTGGSFPPTFSSFDSIVRPASENPRNVPSAPHVRPSSSPVSNHDSRHVW
jgi:hypothetical protein